MPHGIVKGVDDWSKYLHGLYSEATVFYFLQGYRYVCEFSIISCHSNNCWCSASSKPSPEQYCHLHMSHNPLTFNTKVFRAVRPKFGWNCVCSEWCSWEKDWRWVAVFCFSFLLQEQFMKSDEVPRDLDSCLMPCSREVLEGESIKQSWLGESL